MGALLLTLALVVLRASALPLFVEHLLVPALFAGGTTLAAGLFRDLSSHAAAALLTAIACVSATIVPRDWLRMLLGAVAAAFAVVACMPDLHESIELADRSRFWISWHALFALWLLVLYLLQGLVTDGARARLTGAIEPIASGWGLLTLAGLALWSGASFLAGGQLGGASDALDQLNPTALDRLHVDAMRLVSCLLATAAFSTLAWRWPSARRPWCGGVALMLVGLAWLMPTLGAVLLMAATSASSARWRLTVAAGVAAAWIVGSDYYQLTMPLASKAAILTFAGATLAALSWRGWQGWRGLAARIGAARPAAPTRHRQIGVALTLVLVLAVVNTAIWQTEDIIASGQPVLVELAPVDPRSLMQGDYLRLAFRMPDMAPLDTTEMIGAARPHIVAHRDAHGVASLLRVHQNDALGSDEFLIELTPKDGRWILVCDAWFFREGESAHWAKAKYGEFRVTPDGRALLVGLRDAARMPL